MRKIRFGIDVRRAMTGADLYVKVLQISSILPLLYIFTATGYMAIMGSRNVLSVLFDLGMCAIPRVEALALSYLYRLTSSEIFVYFALLAIALAVGVATDKILRGAPDASVKAHRIVAALIGFDLVLRLIPLSFNMTVGLPAEAAGWIVRAVCLALVIRDLKEWEKNK